MEWLYYLLEANLYLLIFYGFYRLFLANETFYNSNRYFLLLTSMTAFVLPIMQLGFLKPAPIVDNALFPPPILYTEEQLSKITFTPVQESFNLMDWLYPIYLIIALGFAIKLGISIFKIINLWLKAKRAKSGNVTLIELKEQKTAFSFFNLLFIHPHLAEKQTVLNHEMVHIKQKHSIDILFFEMLQIVCWFNPIIYFIKKDIKLLHEYIADELSTNSGIQKHEYAMFLIENSFGVVPTPLTNQIFNQSILKRRINMLNKKRTAEWARLRLLLALPLVGVMLCTSTMAFTKNYGYLDLLPEKSKVVETVKQEVPQEKNAKKTVTPKATTAKRDQVKFPPPVVIPDKKAWFTPLYKKDKSTGKPILSENRYILVNGKAIENLSSFYGVSDAESVTYLTKERAISKYGDKGKNGAVEIVGSNIKYFNKVILPKAPPVEPPPPGYKVKRDQIKFPPPIVRKDPAVYKPQEQRRYIPYYRVDKRSGNPVKAEHRYVVINGVPIADQDKFYGAGNTESVTILDATEAKKKYGDQAANGAVELTGTAIEYATSPVVPPPPKEDVVRFPPPIVKPDNKNLKRPPAVEPPPAYKVKRDQVKFPPPIVKPDQPAKNTTDKNQKAATSGNGIVREVLTSQSLFVTSVKPMPNKKDSVNFEAKLKDSYKIISYDERTGKGSTELDWTLLPKNNPPKMGQYYRGSKEYARLGNLIEIEKRRNKNQRS